MLMAMVMRPRPRNHRRQQHLHPFCWGPAPRSSCFSDSSLTTGSRGPRGPPPGQQGRGRAGGWGAQRRQKWGAPRGGGPGRGAAGGGGRRGGGCRPGTGMKGRHGRLRVGAGVRRRRIRRGSLDTAAPPPSHAKYIYIYPYCFLG